MKTFLKWVGVLSIAVLAMGNGPEGQNTEATGFSSSATPMSTPVEPVDSKYEFPESQRRNEMGRKMVKLYSENQGLCGSDAYRSGHDEGPFRGRLGGDTFADPLTACVLAKIAQEWREKGCRDNAIHCRIRMGAISHSYKPRFDKLRSRRNGQCFNIRGLQRKEGAKDHSVLVLPPNAKLTKRGREEHGIVDLQKTKGLMDLVRENSTARPMKVSHPRMKSRGEGLFRGGPQFKAFFWSCIKETGRMEKACRDYVPDPKMCPEVHALFKTPTMQKYFSTIGKNY